MGDTGLSARRSRRVGAGRPAVFRVGAPRRCGQTDRPRPL